jgi:hypothetical protein
LRAFNWKKDFKIVMFQYVIKKFIQIQNTQKLIM